MIGRRAFVSATAIAIFSARLHPVFAEETLDLSAKLAELEAAIRCRLGAAILDTKTGRRWSHRATERFPLCSTFKLLAAAAILQRVDAGREDLGRVIRFGRQDLVANSPVTASGADGGGMTLAAICAAAISVSDNTAGNLMLDSLGGPAAITAFVRSLGDDVTRLDRRETELNEATPGDPRDTTSPDAMMGNLRALLLGDVLSERSRKQLATWMAGSQTGAAKLKAGLPSDWLVGDKTGSGEHGTTNEVAVVTPPGREPILAAIYMTEADAPLDRRNAVFAAIGQALVGAAR